jgi:type VI secretion system protein ImpF
MPRQDNEIRVTLSVLDRLVDYEPEKSREAAMSRTKSLRYLKDTVKRDLEWLLNTRQSAGKLPPNLKELNKSLAAYGLPDFSNVGLKNDGDRNRLSRALEAVIEIFEPRLKDVTVSLEPRGETERILHFRIDGRLKVEPAPEPVTFDTALDVNSGQYNVKGD